MRATIAVIRDRRAGNRFPIQLELKYTSGKISGVGTTRNMGSRSILADLKRPLPVGAKARLHVCWPAELDGNKLQLVLTARVLRVSEQGTALATSQAEFRLRPDEMKCAAWPMLRKVA